MSTRSVMTMRATLQRNEARADESGNIGPADWRTTAHVPCRVWHPSARRNADTRAVVESSEYAMAVPTTTDVVRDDRVLEVYDRRGEIIYADPLYVEAVRRRNDHLEVALREHR